MRWFVGEIGLGVAGAAGDDRVGVGKQTAEGAENGALTAAGRAEENRPGSGEGGIDVQRECTELRGETEVVVRRGLRIRVQETTSCGFELRA
ncbi:MAG TPA: hypothetical protein VGM11_02340 [Acidobacteriaceae bacterium]